MGAIVLDAKKVNSYVLPNLDKSKNIMQDAYSTSQSLRNSLPSSFTYRNLVSDIVTQLFNIKREIKDIDTMISKKVERAKTIENRNDNRISSLATAASKIGSTVGTIAGAKIGLATGGYVGAAAGAYVGNKVGSVVAKGLVNTGAKIVDGATKVAKSIWSGIKDLGKSIWNGCKKVAKAVASFVKKAVSGLVKAAKAVWEGLKWVGKQIWRTVASIVNFAISLVEGIVSFIEAIGDVVLLVIGGVCSIFTFISDVIQGITTGEWNWSATSAVWKKWIVPWVAYDWTTAAFNGIYSWAPFKFLEESAYAPFKRDGGIVYEIGKSVGYYVGVIIASIFTAGAASGAAAATTTMTNAATAVVMATGSLGKNSQKQFNSALQTASTQNREISSAEIWRSIGISTGKAVIDGGTYFVAGQYGGKLASKVASTNIGGKLVANKVGNVLLNDKGMTIALKATKGYTSEGFDSIVTGKKFNFKDATVDAISTAGAEWAAFGFNKLSFSDKIKLDFNKSNVKFIEKISVPVSANSTDAIALTGAATDSAIEANKEVSKKVVWKLLKEAGKQGINKGEEKLIKETTSSTTDYVADLIY